MEVQRNWMQCQTAISGPELEVSAQIQKRNITSTFEAVVGNRMIVRVDYDSRFEMLQQELSRALHR